MPSVERVMAEVKGADPLDTKLRQWAAIQFLVEDLFPAGPPGNVPQSAERAALNKSYFDRMHTFHAELRQEIFGVVDVKPGQATPERASRWKEAYGRMHTYRNGPEFQQQLVRQFFSPESIASHEGQKAAQPGATAAAQRPSAPITTPPGASAAAPATAGAAASGGGEPSQADIQGVLAKARINHSSGHVYEIRSARKLGCRTGGDPSYLCDVEFDACSQALAKCTKGRTTVRLTRNDQGWIAMKK
jgi:hypothetical protein